MRSESESSKVSFPAVGYGIAMITRDSSNALPDISRACSYALRHMVEWSDADIALSALLAVLMTDGDQVVKERLAAVRSFLEDQRILYHCANSRDTTLLAATRAGEGPRSDEGPVMIDGSDELTMYIQPTSDVHRNRVSGTSIRYCRHQDSAQLPAVTRSLRSRGGGSPTRNNRGNKKRYFCPLCRNTFSRLDALRRHSKSSCPFTTSLRRGIPQRHPNNYHRFRSR